MSKRERLRQWRRQKRWGEAPLEGPTTSPPVSPGRPSLGKGEVRHSLHACIWCGSKWRIRKRECSACRYKRAALATFQEGERQRFLKLAALAMRGAWENMADEASLTVAKLAKTKVAKRDEKPLPSLPRQKGQTNTPKKPRK